MLDKDIVDNILEMIESLNEASSYLLNCANDFRFDTFQQVIIDMKDAIFVINDTFSKYQIQETILNVPLMCTNVLDSIDQVLLFSKTRPYKAISKIEYQLIPLLQEMYLHLYYWIDVYKDEEKKKKYYQEEIKQLCSNYYIENAMKTGKYKYELSIYIVGYNKLQYTQLCVNSLLEHLPDNLSYELILVNHGSTDGTKEYFESIEPTKQIDLLENGWGLSILNRIVEGRYVLQISNDVVITANAIENMLTCMQSDDKIAYIVPATPNVSNLQSIEAKYDNLVEMHEFAKKNNISNKLRWEQRVRLCDPIGMMRSEILSETKYIGLNGNFHTSKNFSFPDDAASLLMRRNGYKLILQKDAYCYHFGSLTIKDEIKQKNIDETEAYMQGRRDFFDFYGIDPWSNGFCWDIDLMSMLSCNDDEHIDILGINCGLGSNPLKIRERIKENKKNTNVTIYNALNDEDYFNDIKAVSDFVTLFKRYDELKRLLNNVKFKYVVIEKGVDNFEEFDSVIVELANLLSNSAIVAVQLENTQLKDKIKRKYSNIKTSGKWIAIEI